MATKFKKLKEQLSNLEDGDLIRSPLSPRKRRLSQKGSSKWTRYVLFAAFFGTFLLYTSFNYFNVSSASFSPVSDFVSWVNQPDEELLNGMGDWMQRMGYGELSREQLIKLRAEGVTATYTSRMRDLGYTNISLDDLVRLRQNDVSTTFASMMKELGYTLSIDDLIQLRQHDVTAYYTSNLQDLGYTNITKDELIRMKDTGVTISDIKALMKQQKTKPAIDEIIRYSISNQ